MPSLTYIPANSRHVLLVHPDVGVLTVFQRKFMDAGMEPILARDLPTALLAIAQHSLDTCVVSSRISEENDGWALAAVLHMCFPKAFIGVLAPSLDILSYQAAINSGANEVYMITAPPAEIADKLLQDRSAARHHSTAKHRPVQ